jgi:hypothetical protein
MVDERFLIHRLRSTRWAAIVGAVTVGAFMSYELLVQGTLNWRMLAVLIAMGVTKWIAMLYYHKTD